MSFDPRQHVADRLIDPIRNGKPELGWKGDQNLMLVFARIEQRWELWEHRPSTGQDVMVMAGPPGAEINEQAVDLLIMALVQGDTTRDGNSAEAILERVIRHNDKVDRDSTLAAADATADILAEFYHEAGRAYGGPRTHFGYQG